MSKIRTKQISTNIPSNILIKANQSNIEASNIAETISGGIITLSSSLTSNRTIIAPDFNFTILGVTTSLTNSIPYFNNNQLIYSSNLAYVSSRLNLTRSTIGGVLLAQNNSYNLGGDGPIVIDDGSGISFGLGYSPTSTAYMYFPSGSGIYLHGYGLYGTFIESGNLTVPNKMLVGSNAYEGDIIGTLAGTTKFQVSGGVRITTLTGSSYSMVVANQDGVLSTQSIPTSAALTASYIGYGDGNNILTGRQVLRFDDVLNRLYIGGGTMFSNASFTNVQITGAVGNGGIGFAVANNDSTGWSMAAFGYDDMDSAYQLYFGPGVGGNFTGTNIPFASSAAFQSGSGNDKKFLIFGTPIYNITGFVGTNSGTKLDTNGLRIDNINALHTANSYKLEVVGTTRISTLVGSTYSMVVADQNGVLFTQSVPNGSTPINSQEVVFGTSTGITSSLYMRFNPSQFKLSIGGTTDMGNPAQQLNVQSVLENDSNPVGYLAQNTSAIGYSLNVIGQSSLRAVYEYYYGSSYNGYYEGTSASISDSYYISVGALSDKLKMQSGSTFIDKIGTYSTNLATRFDGVGYRIDTADVIHLTNSHRFFVNGGSGYSLIYNTGNLYITQSGGSSYTLVSNNGSEGFIRSDSLNLNGDLDVVMYGGIRAVIGANSSYNTRIDNYGLRFDNTGASLFTGTNSNPFDVITASGSMIFSNDAKLTLSGLSGSNSRMVEADSNGTLTASKIVIEAWISGSTASVLSATANWDNSTGDYIGPTISGTYKGQLHYDTDFLYIAVMDNLFKRTPFV